ncbi:hypothetical protein QTP88_027423 [Uroleucon formosanum]
MSRACGTKCSYVNCGKSARSELGLKLYRFPKDVSSSRQWILNCGNTDLLHLDETDLYKKRICEHHFVETDFTSSNKRNLKRSSVPQLFTPVEDDILHVTSPKKTYKKKPMCSLLSPRVVVTKRKLSSPTNSSPSKINSPLAMSLSPQETIHVLTPTASHELQSSSLIASTPDITPRTKTIMHKMIDFPSSIKPTKLFSVTTGNTNIIKKLKQVIAHQKKLLMSKRVIIFKLKKNLISLKLQNKHNKSIDFINLLKFPSENAKTLVKMQIARKKSSTKSWSQKEKQLALSLFYKSPSAYKFLYFSKQINLPGLTSIKRWIGNIKCLPGLNNALFKQLKTKVDSMSSQEKYCTLVFDEMKIKNFLEYNKYLDLVEGYEDLGSKGRTNKFAGQAMVFMIRGLYSSWKLPIAYFLPSTSVKHFMLADLITEVLERLFQCGLIVKAIICDQGASNVAAFKDLKMTKEKPYFFIGDNKIYSIFDVPHLFKNLRNHFIRNNFLFNGKEVSFKDLKDTYEIDKKSSTSRSLLHITDAHIHPGPFQKMSCKLAMQLFSHRVATAMKTCIMTQQLQSRTASQTVEMITKFNNLLDCLNSNSLYNSNPFKCALSDKNPDSNKPLRDTRPVCFDGMVWTLNAIIMLYKEQDDIGYNYLLTRRLDSDVIENMFAVFRQRGGYNRNPTARTFRTTLRMHVKSNLMQPTMLSNCEADDDINLFSKDDKSTKNSGEESDSSISTTHAFSSISTIDVSTLEEYEAKILSGCMNVMILQRIFFPVDLIDTLGGLK